MIVSIVIPNWNGKKLLEKNLPKVLKTKADEVIVIDDFSSDDSEQVIRSFKDITLIKNEKNLGFVESVNRGVSQAKGDVVALLNNDVSCEKDFLDPLLHHFEDKNIFAVSANELDFSWAKASFDGFIHHSPGPKTSEVHVSFWASGGSAAFSKEKWQKLGGMDHLYHPFYWEDIDLSYRAWKRGWKVLWDPASIVHHEHGETIEKFFSQSFRDYISDRNHLLFIWKNITSEGLYSTHKKELLKKLMSGKLIRPFSGALLKIGDVFKKREIEENERKVKDEEIFGLFQK